MTVPGVATNADLPNVYWDDLQALTQAGKQGAQAEADRAAEALVAADPTGVLDATTAFNNALASLPIGANGFAYGTVRFGAGSFRINSPTNNYGPGVRVVGAGIYATTIFGYLPITGQAVFSQHGPFTSTFSDFMVGTTYGGGIEDLTIDGTNCAEGTIGYDVGDIMELYWNIRVQNFTNNTIITGCVVTTSSASVTVPSGGFPGVVVGDIVSGGNSTVSIPANCTVSAISGNTLTLSTGTSVAGGTSALTFTPGSGTSIAVWARNYNMWTEKAHGFLSLFNNDNNLVIDVTANPNDGTKHATQSHEFWDLTIRLYLAVFQNGIAIKNGSSMCSGNLRIGGDYQSSVTSLSSYATFSASGTTPTGFPNSGQTSAVDLDLHICMTPTLTLGNAPKSIQLLNGAEMVVRWMTRYGNRMGDSDLSGGTFLASGPMMSAAGTGLSKVTNYADSWQQTATAGTAPLTHSTAGTVIWNEPFGGGTFKLAMYQLTGYENTTATADNINHLYAFTATPAIIYQPAGFGATVTTAHLTLPVSMGAAVTGFVIVAGL